MYYHEVLQRYMIGTQIGSSFFEGGGGMKCVRSVP